MKFTNELPKSIIAILESEGFSCGRLETSPKDGENYIEISQMTPKGEDWIETVWFDGSYVGFNEAVKRRAEDFDVDEEVEIWIPHRGEGGCPSSITDLVKDAEWKKERLTALSDALSKNSPYFVLTERGKQTAEKFIAELKALRKELLDAGKDTADETTIPDVEDIQCDIEFIGLDPDMEYCNGWGATDNSDLICSLEYGVDFVEGEEEKREKTLHICPSYESETVLPIPKGENKWNYLVRKMLSNIRDELMDNPWTKEINISCNKDSREAKVTFDGSEENTIMYVLKNERIS